jgi:hypothetical protein
VAADLLLQVRNEARAILGEVSKAERHIEPEASSGSGLHRQTGHLDAVGHAHQRGPIVRQIGEADQFAVEPLTSVCADQHDPFVGHNGDTRVDDVASGGLTRW